MKEVTLDEKESHGQVPYDLWTLYFTVQKTGKKYVFYDINHQDYLAFRSKYYNAENALGWSGFNFLKEKYTPEEIVERTKEEDEKIDSLFAEIKKKFNKSK